MTHSGSEDAQTTEPPDDVDRVEDATITPDPFLAKVAKVPSRGDGPSRLPRPGDKFGRFDVQNELGRGGMGIVYAAIDPTLGREVALKVLPSSGDSQRRRRFLREARSAAAVSHPGIATVYEVGEQDGTVFIAMERVRGKTLRVWLDEQKKAPFVAAQKIVLQVARTLAKAHEHGVVHRDLKPENAMISSDGEVKLLDFGLAKLVGEQGGCDRATTDTQEGQVLGTPCYMSPEQARGLAVDARSDVFSFGVMTYELLTGRRPFLANNSADLLAAVTRDDPVPISQLSPEVPQPIIDVVNKCLNKTPADRYADGRALLNDLEAACTVETAQVAKPEASTTTPKRSLSWSTIVALLVVPVVLVVGFFKYDDRVKASASNETLPSARAAASHVAVHPAAAVEAYRKGMTHFRKGMPWGSLLTRAIEIDPTMGSAYAQLAAARLLGGNTEQAREHYWKAVDYSATLSDTDRVLVNAIEPLLLRQPSDWAESIRRLSKATQEFPKNADLLFFLAVATANFDDFSKANEHLKRALELDPQFAQAWHLLSVYTAYQGRLEAAEQLAEECLKLVPESTSCMYMLSRLKQRAGSCDAMASLGRRMIATTTTRAYGEVVLAESLASRGQPLATVEQAIDQAEQNHLKVPSIDVVAIKQQYDAYHVLAKILAGEFESAETRARELETSLRSSHMQEEHGMAATVLTQIMLETGRMQEAGDAAMKFLDRRDAWEPNPSAEDIAIARDATPFLLLATAESGRLSPAERTKRRDGWLRDWESRVTPIARNYLWKHAYAATANSEDEAREAIAAMTRYSPIPPFQPDTLVDAYVGRMYLLASRMDDAIEWLERATRRCSALQFAFDHTRAHLWLGQAKESNKDTQGACAAYRVVTDRWGRAKPKSISATQALTRMKALGCPA